MLPDHSARLIRVVVMVITLLALMVIALSVPIRMRGRITSSVGDLVHAPLFGGMTFVFLCALQAIRSAPKSTQQLLVHSAVIASLMLGFGLITEFAQRAMSRTASIHDAVANGLGILAAFALFWFVQLNGQQPRRIWTSRALLMVAILAVGAACWAPVRTLVDVVAVHRQFPLIGSFESTTELTRWYFRQCRGELTRQNATDGSYAMELTVNPVSHPGARLIELHSDWSEAKTLQLDVTLDASHGEDVTFVVQVMDERHRPDQADTFWSEWTLHPGETEKIRISSEAIVQGPVGRDLNLSRIKYLELSLLEPGKTAKLQN